MATDPIATFLAWRDEAAALGEPEPDAMSLATVSAAGHPAVRIVLFRGIRRGRVCFFTNYRSQKGEELTRHPHAALAFFWPRLGIGRQVRIEGPVERLLPAESDAYFASRPRGHQLGAWASAQSQPITDLSVVDQKAQALEREYEGREVPRPDHWGGFGLDPQRIELWTGRANRLHERLVYEKYGEGWSEIRLSP